MASSGRETNSALTAKHLIWTIPIMGTGFLASYVFSDVLILPIDFYYLVYFLMVIFLFLVYVRRTKLDLKVWFYRRFKWALVLAFLFSLVMIQNVLSRPETTHLSSPYFYWSLFWRGLIYGSVDGLLLSAFPWIVTWRALRGEAKSIGAKFGVALVAWILIVLTTTVYHSGYSDFRSEKLLQANIGNTIMSLPTLVSANPIASIFTHAAMHITAVIHSPETDLFLPPHH